MTFLNFKACRRSCFFPIYSVLHLLYNTRRCHVAVHFFFFFFVKKELRVYATIFFSSFFTRLETGPTRHVDDERPSKFLISSVYYNICEPTKESSSENSSPSVCTSRPSKGPCRVSVARMFRPRTDLLV